MSHKTECVILLAEWKHDNDLILKIVLKADDISDSHAEIPYTYSIFLESLIRFKNISFSVAKHVLSECDKNADGVFSLIEASYCLHMFENDEILTMMLLSGNRGIPTLYGTCGNMVAVEYVTSSPLVALSIVKEYRSWDLRAKMALALIEMIEGLEDTRYGTLFLCDFQRGNFGFVENDGHLIAKSIDNDLSLFRNKLYEQLKSETLDDCKSDSDCDFLHCMVPCDKDTRKCSGRLVTNNLQMLCNSIFLSSQRFDFMYSGLLWNPPMLIKKQIKGLLHQCAHPLTESDRISRSLARQLKRVLKNSINS